MVRKGGEKQLGRRRKESREQESVRGREVGKRTMRGGAAGRGEKMRQRSSRGREGRKSVRITKVCPLYFKDIISSLDEIGKKEKNETKRH